MSEATTDSETCGPVGPALSDRTKIVRVCSKCGKVWFLVGDSHRSRWESRDYPYFPHFDKLHFPQEASREQ